VLSTIAASRPGVRRVAWGLWGGMRAPRLPPFPASASGDHQIDGNAVAGQPAARLRVHEVAMELAGDHCFLDARIVEELASVDG
jgi:hypothetical protein